MYTEVLTDLICSDRTQHENGAFANYIVAKGDVQIKTPDNISDEDAATLGISVATVVSVLQAPPFSERPRLI